MRRFAAAASANLILVKRNSGPTDASAETAINDHTATGYEDGGANVAATNVGRVCDPATPVSALVLKSNSRAVKDRDGAERKQIVSARSRFRAADVEKANANQAQIFKNARR